MYAIIKTSGKQYKVEKGTVLTLDRQKGEAGDAINLDDNVLMVSDGDNVTFGTPTVKGAKVTLEIKEHLRGPKLVVFKMKRRKRYRNKQGHRQELTKVEVKDIVLG
ncbi:MAG: 50S ribosomal protein L21 [Victivallales bacterium]|nr:50S ribosomal protein L21 [Victivallales bacterium]